MTDHLEREKAILARAKELFDVVGVVHHAGESVLVLGLVTTEQRDLDDFYREVPGRFSLRGHEIHALPLLEKLIAFIRERGLEAELQGHCGYPRGSDFNLKQQAVAAGLGEWGKNSLVIHPHYGPWLRFMAVRTSGIFSPTGSDRGEWEKSPYCEDCTACIDACPPGVLASYYVRDRANCQASIELFPDMGKLEACDLCLASCPAGG